MAVFLEITGAFDNLTWRNLYEDLAFLNASEGSIAITKSHLSGRTASLIMGGSQTMVKLTKGCPQGSIFGPLLWNSSMETLQLTELPEYATIQAYADDIAVSIAGRSRRQLKERDYLEHR